MGPKNHVEFLGTDPSLNAIYKNLLRPARAKLGNHEVITKVLQEIPFENTQVNLPGEKIQKKKNSRKFCKTFFERKNRCNFMNSTSSK